MPFEWDKHKNQTNLTKHGVSFQEAKHVFSHPRISWQDTRKNYGESRFLTIGTIGHNITIVIAYTIRNRSIRIISARKANQKEREHYNAHIKN